MGKEPAKETLMLKFMPVFVTLAAACSFVLVLHIIFTLQDYFKD
jgi:hypothetical protein